MLASFLSFLGVLFDLLIGILGLSYTNHTFVYPFGSEFLFLFSIFADFFALHRMSQTYPFNYPQRAFQQVLQSVYVLPPAVSVPFLMPLNIS